MSEEFIRKRAEEAAWKAYDEVVMASYKALEAARQLFIDDMSKAWDEYEKDKPKPERDPSPGPEPGPEYQCGNCGYVSDKPGRCPRCGETT